MKLKINKKLSLNTVLGFSMTGSVVPAGDGILTTIEVAGDGSDVSLSVLVLSGADANSLDALGRGATEGLKLAANVAAMLIAFVSLVAMFNYLLGFWNFKLFKISKKSS